MFSGRAPGYKAIDSAVANGQYVATTYDAAGRRVGNDSEVENVYRRLPNLSKRGVTPMRKPTRKATTTVIQLLIIMLSLWAIFYGPRYVRPVYGWALLDKHERRFMKAVMRTFPVEKESVDYRSAWIFDGSVSVRISDISASDAGLVSGNTTESLTWKNERLPIRIQSYRLPLRQKVVTASSFILPDSQHIVSVEKETEQGSYDVNGPGFYEESLKGIISDLLDSLE